MYTQEQVISYKGIISEFCTNYLNNGNNQVGVVISHDGNSYSGIPFKAIDEILYAFKTYISFTHDIAYNAELTKSTLLEIGAVFINSGLYFTNAVVNYNKLLKLEMQHNEVNKDTSENIEKQLEKMFDRIKYNTEDCYNRMAAAIFEINDKLLPQKSDNGYSIIDEIKNIINDRNDTISEFHTDVSSLGIQDLSNNPIAQMNIEE